MAKVQRKDNNNIGPPWGLYCLLFIYCHKEKIYSYVLGYRYMTTTNRKETWHTSNEYVQRIDLHEYCIYMTVTKN